MKNFTKFKKHRSSLNAIILNLKNRYPKQMIPYERNQKLEELVP